MIGVHPVAVIVQSYVNYFGNICRRISHNDAVQHSAKSSHGIPIIYQIVTGDNALAVPRFSKQATKLRRNSASVNIVLIITTVQRRNC